jgi:exosortase K
VLRKFPVRLRWSSAPSTLGAGAGALGLAVGLKAFYSHAGSSELLWILAPSVWLAKFVGGIDLAYEPGAGFISHTYRMVVGPACAGVNFIVICFLTLYFCFSRYFPNKVRWLVSSAILSYIAAVAVNGLRIFLSAHLWTADFYVRWITPGQMHRLAGTVVYFVSLLGLYIAVESAMGVRISRSGPLIWYVGVTLGVPLAGRIIAGGTSGFAEHAAWVLGIVLVVTALIFLPSALRNRVFWRA